MDLHVLARKFLRKCIARVIDVWCEEGTIGGPGGPGELVQRVTDRVWEVLEGAKIIRAQRPQYVLQLTSLSDENLMVSLTDDELQVLESLMQMGDVGHTGWTFKDWRDSMTPQYIEALRMGMAKIKAVLPARTGPVSVVDHLLKVDDLPQADEDDNIPF